MPRQHLRIFNTLAERFGLEYADVIQLTCEHWDELVQPDRDTLLAHYESVLVRYMRRSMSHRMLHQYARLLSDAVDVIHEELYPSLSQLAEEAYTNIPVGLRLIGWRRFEPVFEMYVNPTPTPW